MFTRKSFEAGEITDNLIYLYVDLWCITVFTLTQEKASDHVQYNLAEYIKYHVR